MGPIGVFDSGFGGLTVLRSLTERLPEYDYLYLGDNARTPYGTRSYESVYEFTLEGVRYLFDQGCHLVILACNTASAKALRTIQQNDLPQIDPHRRVLGVIRPTTEEIGNRSESGHVGIFATPGTVNSESYTIEIAKFFPNVKVLQEACPMWVPLVENNELDNEGSDYFIRKHVEELLRQDRMIDTVLLACTHYPLLEKQIRKYLPAKVNVITQGDIVAASLEDYLARHPEIEIKCSKTGGKTFLTTDLADKFAEAGSRFFGKPVSATQIHL
jgi:glutamate racemase